jgi:hypothetical protein
MSSLRVDTHTLLREIGDAGDIVIEPPVNKTLEWPLGSTDESNEKEKDGDCAQNFEKHTSSFEESLWLDLGWVEVRRSQVGVPKAGIFRLRSR